MMKLIINNYTAILKKNYEFIENRELFIIFFRFCTYSFNLFFLLFILEINIFITLFICYWINLIFWDIITTWYILDYIRGLINKKENKYVNNKIYINIVSVVDLYFWLKNYIKKEKDNWWKNRKKLKKNESIFKKTYKIILYIIKLLLKVLTLVVKIHNNLISYIYTYFNKNSGNNLNFFWYRIIFNKIDLDKKLIKKNYINNLIKININKYIELHKKYDLNFYFLKNKLIDIYDEILWKFNYNLLKPNKINKNILYFFYKLIEFIFFIIKNDIKFTINNIIYIHIFTKKYINMFIYNYIYNINIYILLYNIYLYIFIYLYSYSIYIINIYIYIINNKIKENNKYNIYINNYIYNIIIYNINKLYNFIYLIIKYTINKLFKILNIKINLIEKLELNYSNYINNKKNDIIFKKEIYIYIKNKLIHFISINHIEIKQNFNKLIILIISIKTKFEIIIINILNINWKKIILELKIYYVNKKRPFKQFKYDNSIYIIKYLDELEYAMLTHKKLYIGRNITKYHKKKYIVKKIPSILEKEIKNYKNNFNKKYLEIKKIYTVKLDNYLKFTKLINVKYKYNKYVFNFTTLDFIYFIINNIIKNIIPFYLNNIVQKFENMFTINIYKIYNIYIINKEMKQKYKTISFKKPIENINDLYNIQTQFIKSTYIKSLKYNFLFKIKLNNINYTKYINNYMFMFIIISPFLLINWLISDIALSVTYLKNKKIKKIKKITTKLYKLIYFIKSKIKIIYIYLKKFINFIFCKTIYITFLVAYFYNKKSMLYINENYIRKRYFYYIENELINYIIINKNILLFTLTIGGLLLTIKWSRGVHRFFGNYLWTMLVFPLFLESHKIWYFKLVFTDFLKYKTPENIILFKLNILEKFNYNLYNIYYSIYILILVWFLYYTIKHGGFRTAYANLRAPRWFFIKYPILFLIIESLRLQFIKFISLFILYFNSLNNLELNIFNSYIWLNDLFLIKTLVWFSNRFLINIGNFPYYILYIINIPNFYILNFIFDSFLIYFSLKWLVNYCKVYLKKDKYVAFPLVMFELFLKYSIYFYFIFYFLIAFYDIGTEPSGKIFEYIALLLTLTYLYLEIRVHKIPRKTMPWYFRQIVELWPTTALNMWTTSRALYSDQQKYLSMRQKFRHYKEAYKINYNSVEIWEKKIFLAYQRDKEINLYNFSAFCRLMYRKEGMLREFNIYDYQGWQQDWTWFYKNIRIYHWKLDWWDKPHIYLFNKYILLKNVAKYYVNVIPFAYRFASRYTYLTMHFFIVKIIDLYYGYKFIICDENTYRKWIYKGDMKENEDEIIDEFDNIKHKFFFRGRKHWKLCVKWRQKHKKESDYVRRLRSLKRLKKILMEFSSGERLKTPDWAFPLDFEKQYKKEGWKMFENTEIDNVVLDWRPIFKEW